MNRKTCRDVGAKKKQKMKNKIDTRRVKIEYHNIPYITLVLKK